MEEYSVRWNDREIHELLSIWGDRNVQNHLKLTFRNQNIFEDIAEALHERGVLKTAEQCRIKIKKFKGKYRAIKEQCQKEAATGNFQPRKVWQYYNIMDRIMTDNQNDSMHEASMSSLHSSPIPSTSGSFYSLPTENPTAIIQDSIRNSSPVLTAKHTFYKPPTKLKPRNNNPQQLDDVNSQEVFLRWNSFHENIQNTFPFLLTSEKFVDVSLFCEGHIIKAHKIVLSSCSNYLDRILSEIPVGQHPVIMMPREMRYWQLKSLIDFMYSGEITVEREKLAELLQAAENLDVKGLTTSENNEDNTPDHLEPEEEAVEEEEESVAPPSPPSPIPAKRKRTRSNSPTNIPLLPNSSAVSIRRIGGKKSNNQQRETVAQQQTTSPGIEIKPLAKNDPPDSSLQYERYDYDSNSNNDEAQTDNNHHSGLKDNANRRSDGFHNENSDDTGSID